MLYHGIRAIARNSSYDSAVSADAFSPQQFEVARMFVARLRAEASGEPFDFETVGLDWAPVGDPLVAFSDTVGEIFATDLTRSALILIWSLMSELAFEREMDVKDCIAELGVSLAAQEPPIQNP